MGWQHVTARSAVAGEIGWTGYVETLRRRAHNKPAKPGAWP